MPQGNSPTFLQFEEFLITLPTSDEPFLLILVLTLFMIKNVLKLFLKDNFETTYFIIWTVYSPQPPSDEKQIQGIAHTLASYLWASLVLLKKNLLLSLWEFQTMYFDHIQNPSLVSIPSY